MGEETIMGGVGEETVMGEGGEETSGRGGRGV